jgi:hypothetical protein
MDKSWINSRLFSKQHIAGVRDFLNLISERFAILLKVRRYYVLVESV